MTTTPTTTKAPVKKAADTSAILKTVEKNKALAKSPILKKGVSPLAAARAALTKVLKEDHVVPLNEGQLRTSMPHHPTGAITMDFLIGGRPNHRGVPPCPGLPQGRIVNVYGTAGAGKTTFALTAAAAVTNAGGTCVYIDWENEVEPRYAEAIGVPVKDESRFLLMQPNTLEEGLKIMVQMASAGVDLIVVDSVGAGVPQDVFDRTIEDEGNQTRIGLVAGKWSQFLPKFKTLIRKSMTTVIGISQLRKKINAQGHGPDSDVQGGEAWKYYSAVRIMLRVFGKEKGKVFNAITGKTEDTVVGTIVLARLDKCKVSDSVHHEQRFYLRSGTGIDNARSVLDLAIVYKIIGKSGAWYEWENAPGGPIKAQGMEALGKQIAEREGLLQVLFSQIVPKLSAASTPVYETTSAGPEMGEEIPEDLFEMIPETETEKAARKAAEAEAAEAEADSEGDSDQGSDES